MKMTEGILTQLSNQPAQQVMVLMAAFGILILWYLWRYTRMAKQAKGRPALVLIKALVRVSYFSLATLSLMGLTFGVGKKEIKSVGKDIFLLVDISQSMNTKDVQPSRLEKTKFEIKKIAREFDSDNIGIIAFSQQAFMQCPLTFDDNMLMIVVEAMNTNQISAGGTDFAPALEMAVEKLQNADGKTPQSSRSKVVILISDGEDFGDETITSARKLKEQGIKLFTLGVGTSSGSKIPNGNSFKTDREGQVVISKLNAASLRDLASISDGQYYEISDKRNDVQKLINDIGEIEGEMTSKRQVDAESNKYYYLLFPAIILMILDFTFLFKVIKI